MISETARVVAIERDHLWVETLRRSTCQSCSAQKACGHGLMAKAGSQQRLQLRVAPGDFPLESFSLNDQLRIAIPERLLLGGAFTVYLLPLLGLLLGAAFGAELGVSWATSTGVSSLANEDVLAFIGAVIGLSGGLLYVAWRSRQPGRRADLIPTVISREPAVDEPVQAQPLSM